MTNQDEAPLAYASGIFSARFVGAKSAEAENASHSSASLTARRFSAKADKKWEILGKFKVGKIIDVLLENRGLKGKREKEEFFNPVHPEKISVKSLSINQKEIEETIRRIKDAIKSEEGIVIYGDYDADGICATAILWECLYSFSRNVLPYIPDRFSEGYGLNADSIQKLKSKNEKLKVIVTVDNGIVAHDAVDAASELGIDVIITDHHKKGKKLPKAYSIIHTEKISGSGIAWVLAREIKRKIKITKTPNLQTENNESLDLCAIGTIADQLPLIGPNRSLVRYGLVSLNKTKRPGLIALFQESGLTSQKVRKVPNLKKIGTYEVNYIIAPRINAMGRMEHALDSLRLLCTTNKKRAFELAKLLGKTNAQRQKILDKVVLHAREKARVKNWQGAIVLAHESYHEGVIGLAASKLVEEFWRPVVVVSRGEGFSKASARSVPGFNIIESIRKLDSLIVGGGGHSMAAGFTIKTDKIEVFAQEFDKISSLLLTDELLQRKVRIDTELEFSNIVWDLAEALKGFEPTGIGNPTPTFVTRSVNVLNARMLGKEGSHLRLSLEKDGKVFAVIGFGLGELFSRFLTRKTIDVAYNIFENDWNGRKNLELRIRDIKFF